MARATASLTRAPSRCHQPAINCSPNSLQKTSRVSKSLSMMLMDISFQQQHFVKQDSHKIRRCQYFQEDIHRRDREAATQDNWEMGHAGPGGLLPPREVTANLNPKLMEGIMEFVQAGNPGAHDFEKGVTMLNGRLKLLATASLPKDSLEEQEATCEVRISTVRRAEDEASVPLRKSLCKQRSTVFRGSMANDLVQGCRVEQRGRGSLAVSSSAPNLLPAKQRPSSASTIRHQGSPVSLAFVQRVESISSITSGRKAREPQRSTADQGDRRFHDRLTVRVEG